MSSLCHYSFIHDLSIHNFVCHFTAPCIYFSPSTHETFFIDNETYRLPSYHLLFLVHKSFHIRKHSDCFSTEKIYIYSILLRRKLFFSATWTFLWAFSFRNNMLLFLKQQLLFYLKDRSLFWCTSIHSWECYFSNWFAYFFFNLVHLLQACIEMKHYKCPFKLCSDPEPYYIKLYIFLRFIA